MKLKKLFAAVLAVVLMFSCLPFAANAKSTSVLLVGEKDKSDHNLIERYKNEGFVKVIAVDTTTKAYYTVHWESGVGYVLTFFNNYTMSEMVTWDRAYSGIYCDGDLTIRLAGAITFDANDTKKKNANGIRVEGQLTIENALTDENGIELPSTTPHSLTVNGYKVKSSTGTGSMGIYAGTLMLNNVDVTANGGYAGVKADEALVIRNSNLSANTDESLYDGEDYLFKYSIETNHYIQCGGDVKTKGDIKLESFYDDFGVTGTHSFDEKPIVYARYYKLRGSFNGIWHESFSLFSNPSLIPSCMYVTVPGPVASTSGDSLVLKRRGSTSATLMLKCGRDYLTFDKRDVSCRLEWWQWLGYIFTGTWFDEIFDR